MGTAESGPPCGAAAAGQPRANLTCADVLAPCACPPPSPTPVGHSPWQCHRWAGQMGCLRRSLLCPYRRALSVSNGCCLSGGCSPWQPPCSYVRASALLSLLQSMAWLPRCGLRTSTLCRCSAACRLAGLGSCPISACLPHSLASTRVCQLQLRHLLPAH